MQQDFKKLCETWRTHEPNCVIARDRCACAICGTHGDASNPIHAYHFGYSEAIRKLTDNCPKEEDVILCEQHCKECCDMDETINSYVD